MSSNLQLNPAEKLSKTASLPGCLSGSLRTGTRRSTAMRCRMARWTGKMTIHEESILHEGLAPLRVVCVNKIGQPLHPLLDALSHRLAGIELRFLREHAHRVTRLKMDMPVELPVEAGEDPQKRTLPGAVEPEHTDLRAVKERQADVADDLLPLDVFETPIIENMTLGSSGFAMRAPSHTRRGRPRKPSPRAQRIPNHFRGDNRGNGENGTVGAQACCAQFRGCDLPLPRLPQGATRSRPYDGGTRTDGGESEPACFSGPDACARLPSRQRRGMIQNPPSSQTL